MSRERLNSVISLTELTYLSFFFSFTLSLDDFPSHCSSQTHIQEHLGLTIKEWCICIGFLSQILIIHKVNWVYFLTPWIFIDPHAKKDTPVHFHSVSLPCHFCLYSLDGLARWSQWPLVSNSDALGSKTTATKSGRHVIKILSFPRQRHLALGWKRESSWAFWQIGLMS